MIFLSCSYSMSSVCRLNLPTTTLPKNKKRAPRMQQVNFLTFSFWLKEYSSVILAFQNCEGRQPLAVSTTVGLPSKSKQEKERSFSLQKRVPMSPKLVTTAFQGRLIRNSYRSLGTSGNSYPCKMFYSLKDSGSYSFTRMWPVDGWLQEIVQLEFQPPRTMNLGYISKRTCEAVRLAWLVVTFPTQSLQQSPQISLGSRVEICLSAFFALLSVQSTRLNQPERPGPTLESLNEL